MTQFAFPTIDPLTHSGTELASWLNSWKPALLSQHAGSSRPSYATQGMLWVDTSAMPAKLNMYDGADDIQLGTFDFTNNIFTPGGNAVSRTLVDAKGDLLVGTAADVLARKAIGNNGCILMADSAQSDGMAWVEAQIGADLLTNGSLAVWQRGTSFSAAGYSVAGWHFDAANSATLTQSVISSERAYFAARVQRPNGNAGTSVIRLCQPIETHNAIRAQGLPVTLSFDSVRDTNYSATGNILVSRIYTGTGTDQARANMQNGTWSGATWNDQSNALLSGWQRFHHTITVAANVTQLGVEFRFTPTGTAGAADGYSIRNIALQIGSVGLPFQVRPIGLELALCQRIFAKSYDLGTTPGSVTAAGAPYLAWAASGSAQKAFPIFFPARMRATPTITIYAPSDGSSGKIDVNNVAVAAFALNVGDGGFSLVTNDTTSATSVRAHWTASAEL